MSFRCPVGREEEGAALYTYLRGCVDGDTGGFIYVSGVPGSGKTYTTEMVLEAFAGEGEKATVVKINCSKARRPRDVFNLILGAMGEKGKGLADLKAAFSKHSYTILLLDEVDLLITRTQDVLYGLFDIPNTPNTKVSVVAISNTISLPEKVFTSKVRSRVGRNRINFAPYSSAQLTKILTLVLGSQEEKEKEKENAGASAPAFEPSSLLLCANKVSSINGDVRKALEVAEVAMRRGRKVQKRKITVFDIDTVLRETYQSVQYLFINDLSLYQQILLIILSKREVLHINPLYEQLKSILSLYGHSAISFDSFKDILDDMEDVGVVKRSKRKMTYTTSFISEELRMALTNPSLKQLLA